MGKKDKSGGNQVKRSFKGSNDTNPKIHVTANKQIRVASRKLRQLEDNDQNARRIKRLVAHISRMEAMKKGVYRKPL